MTTKELIALYTQFKQETPSSTSAYELPNHSFENFMAWLERKYWLNESNGK